jgi:hypothetical protein
MHTGAGWQGDVIAEVSSAAGSSFSGNNRGPVSVGVGGSTGSYGSGVGVGVGVNLNALGDQRGSGNNVIECAHPAHR